MRRESTVCRSICIPFAANSFDLKVEPEISEVVRTSYNDASSYRSSSKHVPLGRRHQGRPRKLWRNYISQQAQEHLGIHQNELESVPMQRNADLICTTSFHRAPHFGKTMIIQSKQVIIHAKIYLVSHYIIMYSELIKQGNTDFFVVHCNMVLNLKISIKVFSLTK